MKKAFIFFVILYISILSIDLFELYFEDKSLNWVNVILTKGSIALFWTSLFLIIQNYLTKDIKYSLPIEIEVSRDIFNDLEKNSYIILNGKEKINFDRKENLFLGKSDWNFLNFKTVIVIELISKLNEKCVLSINATSSNPFALFDFGHPIITVEKIRKKLLSANPLFGICNPEPTS